MKQDVEEQFLRAYDDLSEPLYRHLYFRVYRRERAQELLQDVFMKTWNYLAAGNQVDNLKAFLYRVANNLAIDESRKKKEHSLDQLLADQPKLEPVSDDGKHPEKQLLIEQIFKVVDEFEEPDRSILVLRYHDDLDPKEIAVVLKISANNVSVRLHRAHERLKIIFNKDDNAREISTID